MLFLSIRIIKKATMRLQRPLVLAALGGACLAAQAVTLVSTGFDTGAEGWFAANGASSTHYATTGGDPGGYVWATDTTAQKIWIFVAPSAYFGDFSAALAGSLSFSLRTSSPGTPQNLLIGDVKISGNGIDLVTNISSPPTATWTNYSVTLAPSAAWYVGVIGGTLATSADFASVLSNVSALHIRGDFTNTGEATGLDSVVLATAAPVPEPASWALLLAGAGAITSLVRRRR
jgi:hypothetical protein